MHEGRAQAAHEGAGGLDWTERSQPARMYQSQNLLGQARWGCRRTLAPEPPAAVGDKSSPSECSAPLHCI